MASWIFFADMLKPWTQRALAKQIGQEEKVVVVGQAGSVLRNRSLPPFRARHKSVEGALYCRDYRPLYFPGRLPGLGKLFRHLNQRLLKRELDRLLPPEEERIVFYDQPMECDLVKSFGEALSIYLASDDLTLTVWGETFPKQVQAEIRMLGKIDAIICVSRVLAETLQSRIPEGRMIPVHVLPNGYDEHLFNPDKSWKEPAALRPVPKPRVLVAGYVSERIDWEGIAGAARARPDWTWVFTGPVTPGMPEKIKSLGETLNQETPSRSFPKMIWLGEFPNEEVPAFITHCDVCAVPYRLNAFTRSSSPVKAFEYLAMGAPVLSSRTPSLEAYGKVVQWVEEGKGESYAMALDRLAAEGRDRPQVENRRFAVREDSWPHRARELKTWTYEILRNLTAPANRSPGGEKG
jgi:glycosyltransferase involved in cell wall biosynthesis